MIQQSATWSDYKSHNTGKGLIGISPTLLPVLACDIYPGSISDEEIVRQSGILREIDHKKRKMCGRYEKLKVLQFPSIYIYCRPFQALTFTKVSIIKQKKLEKLEYFENRTKNDAKCQEFSL